MVLDIPTCDPGRDMVPGHAKVAITRYRVRSRVDGEEADLNLCAYCKAAVEEEEDLEVLEELEVRRVG